MAWPQLIRGETCLQLHKVKKVVESRYVDEIGSHIASGWKLVAVVSGKRWISGQSTTGPVYVLGR